MQGTENATMLLGRVLLSLLFLIGGTIKLLGPAANQAIFVNQGLPMVEAAWILAVVVEVGGGLAMLCGLFTRPVGLVLAIWCVATALIAHSNIADRAQEIQFFKNMGLTGGFLYVAAFGAGAWSLDAWRPVASGWSGCRVGLAPTGKRRLFTAHTQVGHLAKSKECQKGTVRYFVTRR